MKAYRKMDVTWECISHILELREILLSFQTGFNYLMVFTLKYVIQDIKVKTLIRKYVNNRIRKEMTRREYLQKFIFRVCGKWQSNNVQHADYNNKSGISTQNEL